MRFKILWLFASCFFFSKILSAQQGDTAKHEKNYKNVVRYNLSGALLFGLDRYVVFGYERVINNRQSISVNFGKAALPKLVSIITDSFNLNKDIKNRGTNFSVDYRFYLAKENKYSPPHGLYIGPYYSFNQFNRENEFSFKRGTGDVQAGTVNTKFTINTFGAELGYQFVLWKRFALDMVLVGPGISTYKINTKFDGTLSEKDREQLRDAVQQVLTQRFPGMNYVLSDKEINANGTLNTTNLGFRYIVHIGFLF